METKGGIIQLQPAIGDNTGARGRIRDPRLKLTFTTEEEEARLSGFAGQAKLFSEFRKKDNEEEKSDARWSRQIDGTIAEVTIKTGSSSNSIIRIEYCGFCQIKKWLNSEQYDKIMTYVCNEIPLSVADIELNLEETGWDDELITYVATAIHTMTVYTFLWIHTNLTKFYHTSSHIPNVQYSDVDQYVIDNKIQVRDPCIPVVIRTVYGSFDGTKYVTFLSVFQS